VKIEVRAPLSRTRAENATWFGDPHNRRFVANRVSDVRRVPRSAQKVPPCPPTIRRELRPGEWQFQRGATVDFRLEPDPYARLTAVSGFVKLLAAGRRANTGFGTATPEDRLPHLACCLPTRTPHNSRTTCDARSNWLS
jgi:hypothetical protein